jgi:hypothetical protein
MANSIQTANLTASTTSDIVARRPADPTVEVGVGKGGVDVKVKADISIIEWGRRAIEGTLEKSESFHNLSDDIKQQVKNVNSTLKQQISVDDKVGAVQSLNKLGSLYKQQAAGMSSQALTQESLYIANKYSDLAAKVKSGDFLLKQLQVDKLGSINQGVSGDIASARNQEYAGIVDAYTNDNGKVDLAQLQKDLKDNNADKETVDGVLALVTPEIQQQATPESQAQL